MNDYYVAELVRQRTEELRRAAEQPYVGGSRSPRRRRRLRRIR